MSSPAGAPLSHYPNRPARPVFPQGVLDPFSRFRHLASADVLMCERFLTNIASFSVELRVGWPGEGKRGDKGELKVSHASWIGVVGVFGLLCARIGALASQALQGGTVQALLQDRATASRCLRWCCPILIIGGAGELSAP